MTITHSPSGERQPGSPYQAKRVPTPPMPLAGRTKLEKRLDAYVRRGLTSRNQELGFLDHPTSDPVGFVIEPMAPREHRALVGAKLQGCIACALVTATIVSTIALAIFVFTR